MTDTERDLILEAAFRAAEEDADKHYASLLEAFKAAIPEHFHRVGDYAPKAKRPLAFNADADGFEFFLRLGEEYATTSVIFDYKKTKKLWKVQTFISRIGAGPFTVSQINSFTLANAILASRELYLELKQKAQSVEDSGPVDSRVVVN